ncbi:MULTISPECIES: Gp15 family bacteriophage protein [unclassified Breznakia]|uniref:Gp15 family bacteriophage protein n=1 Tax=unclassified Breznakia TaxID=2623764 RepID=UPI002472ECE0|nr:MULTISPECIES: Gp15 family bacteriophage protein [unclassified Breznakia]
MESSFFKQYGIRLRSVNDMPWNEFCSYLTGIMDDTPLGRIVSIRAEKDKEVIKNFSKEQKQIRNDWLNRNAKKIDKQTYDEVIEGFKNMFKKLAEGGV